MSRTAFTCIAVLSLGHAAIAADPAGVEFFETKIRPVLVKQCYSCHSESARSVKGGLLLDSSAGFAKGGDSGVPLEPGKPDESILIEALRYDGLEMPPDRRLPPPVVRDFEKWVRMGAPGIDPVDPSVIAPTEVDIEAGRSYWAFQPPQRHRVPRVENSAWPLDAIDAFILSELEAAGLEPAADADPHTFLRRLTFDLTGLPPTPKRIAEFVADPSERNIARTVDRLLQSRQFGEHWGRHWLDVARYSDSNGNDFNATFHQAWRYRNYVINAFNDDKPYDEFVREQIAGDLLPYESIARRADAIVATGLLMIGPKMLSERDKEKLRMDVVDEQIDTVGRAFLGLTLGCARCHDHKFDPIPATDYYALAGIFRSTKTLDGEMQQYVSDHARRDLPIEPELAAARKRYESKKKSLEKSLEAAKKQLKAAQGNSQRKLGIVVDDTQATKVGEWTSSTYIKTFIGVGYVHDNKQGKGTKSITYKTRLPHTGEYELRMSFCGTGNREKRVPVRIEHAEGVADTTVDQSQVAPIEELFAVVGRFRFSADTEAVVTVSTKGTKGYVIADAMQFIPVDELGQQPEPSTELVQFQAEVRKLEASLAELKNHAPPAIPRALAVSEAEDAGDCRLCIRGEHNNLGETVPRGFVQVAMNNEPPPFAKDTSGRAELAEWMAGSRNPLTARVIVNRVWSHLLGEGIVRSVDNFGRLGERPTHPELLDRLAVDLIDDGWSLKRMIRRIVLSRAYRQATRHDENAHAADPENRLLWTAHRRRLPVEAIRDSLLSISGKLDSSPVDSTVSELGELVSKNTNDDKGLKRKASQRRTVYLSIIRNELPALLTAFDFADPDMVVGRRPVTNVPAQALLMLNDPFVVESAAQTAEVILESGPSGNDIAARLDRVYLLVLGRRPTADERERAAVFLNDESADVVAEGVLDDSRHRQRWGRLIQALFASTEFRMLD